MVGQGWITPRDYRKDAIYRKRRYTLLEKTTYDVVRPEYVATGGNTPTLTQEGHDKLVKRHLKLGRI